MTVVHHSVMGHTDAVAERLVEGVHSVLDVHCVSKPVLADGTQPIGEPR
jgi:hypothetical protein